MELNSFCEKIMLFFDGYFLLRICTDNWSDGFNVTNSKLPIEKESHTETQMICPDDYVRRYNVVIVLSKQRTMKERTNLVDKIVFEYEKFRNWSDWQRKDETSSIILKAKKREKKNRLEEISVIIVVESILDVIGFSFYWKNVLFRKWEHLSMKFHTV